MWKWVLVGGGGGAKKGNLTEKWTTVENFSNSLGKGKEGV